MGILLDFAAAPRPTSRIEPRHRVKNETAGEVIIFPGVRIERDTLDLSARIGTIGRTAGTGRADRD